MSKSGWRRDLKHWYEQTFALLCVFFIMTILQQGKFFMFIYENKRINLLGLLGKKGLCEGLSDLYLRL